jgi:hypothetical protein
MTISQEQLQDFKVYYKNNFDGIQLNDQQALEKLLALTGIIRLAFLSISENQLEEIEKWRKQRRELKNINK